MKRATLLAAFALLAGATPVSANDTDTTAVLSTAFPAIGRLCGFTATTDVTREPGWRTGVLDAGPFVVDDASAVTDVYCTIQVNSSTHVGYSHGQVKESASGSGVVTMPPKIVSFLATAADDVVLCSEIWIYKNGHITLFWAGQTAPNLGYWSSDPSVSCTQVTSFQPNASGCPVLKAADGRLGTNTAEIWQDCEAYEPII